MNINSITVSFKRFTLTLLLVLLAAPVSFAISILQQQNVYAAASLEASVEREAQSYTNYVALVGCAQSRLKDTIDTAPSAPAITTPTTWYGSDIAGGNSYVYPSGTQKNCGPIMEEAAALWGITNYGSFLKGMGYQLDTSKPAYVFKGGSASDRREAFREQVKKIVPNVASVSGAANYAIFIKSLEGDCKGTYVGAYTGTYKAYADSNKRDGDYIFSKVTTSTGDQVYKRLFGKNLTVYGYNSSTSYSAGTLDDQDCSDMVAGVSNNAAAYTVIALKALCQTEYKFTDPLLINACADGAANKADGIMYCSGRYKGAYSAGQGNDGSAQRRACYIGQGNGGGEDCVAKTVGSIRSGYTDTALLTACLYGAQKPDAGACDAKYGPQYTGSVLEKRTDELLACEYGQKFPTVAGGVTLTDDGSGNIDEAVTSCGLGGVGWFVCPALGFVASLTDTAYSFLATTFLETPASLVASGTDSPTYNAWSVMRNIANIAFVIAFLLIIFSQLSNVGVTNYGVKKLLPRLVIAAILVNISYFVCQIAVDLSNILGYGLKALFDNIGGFIQSPSSDLTSTGATGNGFGVAAVTTIVLAGGIGLAFAISVPVLLAAVIALLLIVLILFGRTALIVLLVVISPLAFVAYLLPNTEDLFKKWRKLFFTLLILFPIIAVVFGASNLAAGIINSSASYVGNTDDESVLQIVAIGVALVPLFAVPSLLRGALNGAGAIGQKLSGLSSKASGSIGGKIANTSRAGQYAKYYKGEIDKNRALAQSGSYTGKNPFHRMTSAVNSKINERTGKFGSRASAQGDALADAEDAELLKNATSKIGSMTGADGKTPLSTAQLIQMASGQDVTHDGTATGTVIHPSRTFDQHARRAATQKAAAVANVSEAHQLLNASKGMETALERKTLAAALRTSSVTAKAPWLTGKTLGAIEQGGITSAEAAIMAINDGKVTAEALASGDVTSVKHLVDTVTAMPAGPDRVNAIAALKQAELGYQANPLLHDKVVKGQGHDTAISSITSIV